LSAARDVTAAVVMTGETAKYANLIVKKCAIPLKQALRDPNLPQDEEQDDKAEARAHGGREDDIRR
jgi:hypothetical protein